MEIKDKAIRYFQTQLSENMFIEENGGYLVCENAVLGRVGSQQYTERELGLSQKNDLVDVYRLEQDVFDEDSVASLEGRPFTIRHPKELVTTKNFKKYAVGEVFHVHREGNNLVGDIRVFDEEAKKIIIEGKMRELSLGYEMKLVKDEEKGIYKFMDIIYNHLALVMRGRAKIAMINDSENYEESEEDENLENEEKVIEKVEEVKDEKDEKLEKLKVELDALKSEVELNKIGYKKQEKVEEKEEVEDRCSVKDSNYMIEQLEKIEKIEDKSLRELAIKKVKLECGIVEDSEPIIEETKVETKTEIKDEVTEVKDTIKVDLQEEPNSVQDHELFMQEYLDQFNRKNYTSQQDYEQGLRKLVTPSTLEQKYRKEKIASRR